MTESKQRKTYRLWQEVEAKLFIEAESRGISPAKLLNVILSESLSHIKLPKDKES